MTQTTKEGLAIFGAILLVYLCWGIGFGLLIHWPFAHTFGGILLFTAIIGIAVYLLAKRAVRWTKFQSFDKKTGGGGEIIVSWKIPFVIAFASVVATIFGILL